MEAVSYNSNWMLASLRNYFCLLLTLDADLKEIELERTLNDDLVLGKCDVQMNTLPKYPSPNSINKPTSLSSALNFYSINEYVKR